MRIAGGQWRNRTLKTPKTGTRPTSDKVRQAIFNMLNARGAVVDAVVLDAFCGSGALGLEALSQGASSCVLWDKSPQAIRTTKENMADLQAAQAACALQDAAKIGARPDAQQKFTLVFLDPPYDRGLIPQVMVALRAGDWVEEDCLFVLEMATHENPDLSGYTTEQKKIYGDTKVILAYSAPV
jgi:16S rRNA (guanine966-N2)-methyltransferase